MHLPIIIRLFLVFNVVSILLFSCRKRQHEDFNLPVHYGNYLVIDSIRMESPEDASVFYHLDGIALDSVEDMGFAWTANYYDRRNIRSYSLRRSLRDSIMITGIGDSVTLRLTGYVHTGGKRYEGEESLIKTDGRYFSPFNTPIPVYHHAPEAFQYLTKAISLGANGYLVLLQRDTQQGNGFAVLCKINPDLSRAWEQRFEGEGSIQPLDITTIEQDYLVAYRMIFTDFSWIMVARLNKEGHVLWQRDVGGIGNNDFIRMYPSNDGGALVTVLSYMGKGPRGRTGSKLVEYRMDESGHVSVSNSRPAPAWLETGPEVIDAVSLSNQKFITVDRTTHTEPYAVGMHAFDQLTPVWDQQYTRGGSTVPICIEEGIGGTPVALSDVGGWQLFSADPATGNPTLLHHRPTSAFSDGYLSPFSITHTIDAYYVSGTVHMVDGIRGGARPFVAKVSKEGKLLWRYGCRNVYGSRHFLFNGGVAIPDPGGTITLFGVSNELSPIASALAIVRLQFN